MERKNPEYLKKVYGTYKPKKKKKVEAQKVKAPVKMMEKKSIKTAKYPVAPDKSFEKMSPEQRSIESWRFWLEKAKEKPTKRNKQMLKDSRDLHIKKYGMPGKKKK